MFLFVSSFLTNSRGSYAHFTSNDILSLFLEAPRHTHRSDAAHPWILNFLIFLLQQTEDYLLYISFPSSFHDDREGRYLELIA